jgi:hypothetical protein
LAKSDAWITPARIKLIALLLLGIVLIAAPALWRTEMGSEIWAHDVIRDIGIAVFSAAFLGLTIDWWMRKDFADDVFRASVGYILPPELREQIPWITGHEFIATKTTCKVNIATVSEGIVSIVTEMDREFTNITSVSHPFEAMKEMDEWGKGNLRSEILECELSRPKQPILKHESVIKGEDNLVARTQPVSVPSKGTVRAFYKTIEYKTTNDDLVYTFLKPSVNPEIHVTIAPQLAYWCRFGNHGEQREVRPGLKVLDGTLMPHQYMRIRWWPKAPAKTLPGDLSTRIPENDKPK